MALFCQGKTSSIDWKKEIRRRVTGARDIQSKRLARTKIYSNAKMSSRHIKTHCKIDDASRGLLESAIDKLGLFARAFNRLLSFGISIKIRP